MNVNVRSGLLLGVILLAVTVGSAAAARAVTSGQIVRQPRAPQPEPLLQYPEALSARGPTPTPGPKRR